MMAAMADYADELDALGLRALGTTVLNERREFSSMQMAAIQRLTKANDNQR